MLKLLGLLKPDVDLRKVSGTIFGQGVAGYYDPRTKHLRVVSGAQTTNRFLYEITLAHELTHALEDQRFKLDLESSSSDDAGLANLALVEGSATAVMFTYAERHFTSEQSLGGLLSSLGQDTGDLPPFIEAQLVFPYVQGQEFIKRLYAAGGWGVVDAAYRFRPPASSEQIMHPDKYLAVEQPDKVRLHASPGAGWRRVVGGTWGEWATGELVGNARPPPAGAATATSCGSAAATTARRRAATATRSSCAGAGTTARRPRRFEAALNEWSVGKPGALAVGSRGLEVALALAPSQDLAERLVE